MRKETVKSIFNNHEGQNFIIKTNVANGRGINGVNFDTYSGKSEWERDMRTTCHEYTQIKEFGDGCLIIEVDRYDDAYDSGIFEYCIPYENIVTIEFIVEPKWMCTLPAQL